MCSLHRHHILRTNRKNSPKTIVQILVNNIIIIHCCHQIYQRNVNTGRPTEILIKNKFMCKQLSSNDSFLQNVLVEIKIYQVSITDIALKFRLCNVI